MLLLFFLEDKLNKINMQQFGAKNRRISYSNINPEMPKPHQNNINGVRTKYKEIEPPSLQLKDYKRRLFFLDDNILGKNQSNNYTKSKTSRTHKDTIATMVSQSQSRIEERSDRKKEIGFVFQTSPQKLVPKLDRDEEQNEEDNQFMENLQRVDLKKLLQGETLEGYIMGGKGNFDDQEQSWESEESIKRQLKSYGHLQSVEQIPKGTESEKRMDQRYFNKKQENLKNFKEESQMQNFLHEFNLAKHKMRVQARRRYESKQMLAQLKRATSLPKINPQKAPQIIVPTYEQLYEQEEEEDLDKKVKNIRKHNSLSSLRLLESKRKDLLKQNRKIQQKFSEKELEQIDRLDSQLRRKGIMIGHSTIKNSLLNIRTFDTDLKEQQKYSEPKRLQSYPFKRRF